MIEDKIYTWTDNPTVSGVSICDTDVLNECLMHLKYNNNGDGIPLFTILDFDHILDGEDAVGWAVQGSLITETYPDAVAKIQTDYANAQETTHRGITCKKSADGKFIADISQKTAIDELYDSSGFSDFYILDSVNEQFYLPKENLQRSSRYIVETYSNGSSWYNLYSDGWLEQGGYVASTSNTQTIALYKDYKNTDYNILVTPAAPNTPSHYGVGVSTLNKNVSSFQIWNSGYNYYPYIYWESSGMSNLQNVEANENNMPVYRYYRVGNTVNNETEIDVANVLNDLQLKADATLSNVTNEGKLIMAHASMPGNKSDELTLLPTLGTYTAPADGYYSIGVVVTSARGFICLEINPDDNDNSAQKLRAYAHGAGNGDWTSIFVPVSKGDTARVQYQDVSSTFLCKFVYAQGAA